MRGLTLFASAAVLLCAAIQTSSSQCLSEYDDLAKPSTSTDLSSITDFGLTLFKELFPYKETRNFFYSPYSIWNALALAYFGSQGQTESQLRKVLAVGDKVDTLKKWRSLEFMYKMRQVNQSDFILNIANRAYFDKSVPLSQCLQKILTNELRVADMRKAKKVTEEINGWVSNTTKGRITQLVQPGDVANSLMVLTNAAYFKGTWLYQFKKSKTKKDIFYSSPEELGFVDMMVQKGNFRHGKSIELGAHILELPYTGSTVSMLILLPPFITGDQGFDAMVSRLNSTTLKNALDDLWRLQVEVTIPKFSIEESVSNELISALSRMGVTDLFDASKANMSDFSPDVNLSVGKAAHKAFVEVSEEGTEAAAATAFISFRAARPAGTSKFKCNHPFMFIIYDNVTSNILFVGAYKSPKDKIVNKG